MFRAALFTIAKIWKKPKRPSADEWIKKMWYIYTMEYIKRNEIGSFVETWMDLETVIQSEVCQKEKNKYHILTHVCGIQKNSTDEDTDVENKHMDTKGGRRGWCWWWDELGGWDGRVYTDMYKIDN